MIIELYVGSVCKYSGAENSISGVGMLGYSDKKIFFTTQFRILSEGLTKIQVDYIAIIQALQFFNNTSAELIIYSSNRKVIDHLQGKVTEEDEEFFDYITIVAGLSEELDVSFDWVPESANKYSNKIAQEIIEEIV